MSAIDSVVQVSVTASTQAVSTQSFNIPLIVGTVRTQDVVKVQTFSQPSDMLSAGYTTSSIEYQYAILMYSQAIQPGSFKVAMRSASGDIGADLQAIIAADDTWYGAVFCELGDDAVLAAAAVMETVPKIGIYASGDAAIDQAGTGDLLSQLQSKSYERAMLIVSPLSHNLGIDAGIVGGQLPKAPGSCSWHLKPIVGVSPDALTADQVNTVMGNPEQGTQGKGGNVFINVGGQNVFMPGQMVDGTFVDTRIGLDSLTSLVKTNIFGLMANEDKVPYTDQGCVQIENMIRSAIDTHIGYGFIDGKQAITITHVPVSSVPATVRAQRISPPFTFTCYTTGGIHAIKVVGVVNI